MISLDIEETGRLLHNFVRAKIAPTVNINAAHKQS